MEWIQLSLQTDQDKADFVSEVLTGLGSFSVAYLDAYDEPIFETSVEKPPPVEKCNNQCFVCSRCEQGIY